MSEPTTDYANELPGENGGPDGPVTGGKFEVIEQSDLKLLVRIPPGGPNKSLAVFCILWLGMCCLMFSFVLREIVAGNREGWLFLLFLSPFLLIGLGLTYAWAKMRYTESLILVEPSRVVVQQNFRGRKKLKNVSLAPTTRALLSMAYSENDNPVYRVLIGDETGSVTFGTSMRPEDKPRLVEAINRFLERHHSISLAERVLPNACPGCGTALTRVLVNPDARTPSCPNCNRTIVISLPEIVAPLELPPNSKVDVVESSDVRQVYHISGGGAQAKGTGLFAAVWLIFMAVFTWFLFHEPGVPPLGGILIIGLFWVIGFGLFYWWIRMQFARSFVLLERDRIVVQQVLFGKKSTTETPLGPDSRASLVESYKKNKQPVYRVEVNGTSGSAKFGTPLLRIEKDWFVQRINHFLGHQTTPFPSRAQLPRACPQCAAPIDSYLFEPATVKCVCRKCEAELPASDFAGDDSTPERVFELDPLKLPDDSEVKVNTDDPSRLRFTLPLLPEGKPRQILKLLLLPAVAITVLIVWMTARDIPFANAQAGGVAFVFELIFKLMYPLFASALTLIPLAIMVYVLRGRITVDLDTTRFDCRWRLGPIGPKRSLDPASITRVAITNIAIEKKGTEGRDPRQGFRVGTGGSGQVSKGCVVFAGETGLPLTTFHPIATARQVAGIILFQLRRMGIDPADV